ncbi:uncharacterized protein LOC113463922 [Ceratina calcarata]|uniref:Uncharacterized protein LOC113463922 n=1 Tax=Ceratina calcarata TaxID=156304 RepID=A0AAJ7W941_9HYME|nr:uncharacterized protein LOC113463922 [Ceratina calcarata]XP_026666946.1 uncharacterized protein LOC113463922 [Ceratina calcarata]
MVNSSKYILFNFESDKTLWIQGIRLDITLKEEKKLLTTLISVLAKRIQRIGQQIYRWHHEKITRGKAGSFLLLTASPIRGITFSVFHTGFIGRGTTCIMTGHDQKVIRITSDECVYLHYKGNVESSRSYMEFRICNEV